MWSEGMTGWRKWRWVLLYGLAVLCIGAGLFATVRVVQSAVATSKDYAEQERNCVAVCQPFDSMLIKGQCACMDIEKKWVVQEDVK